MKQIYVLALTISILFSACQNSDKSKSNTTAPDSPVMGDSWEAKYDSIDATHIPDNAIQLIGNDWMLVTAGTEKSYNTMTASWGALGELWGKHVMMITIRNTRYTYEFLESNEGYTLSFFSEDHRGALKIAGSRSGRDGDKVKEMGLTPIVTPSGQMSFAEARMIIECRKLYVSPFNADGIVDKTIFDDWYKDDKTMHTQFISEITKVWIKK